MANGSSRHWITRFIGLCLLLILLCLLGHLIADATGVSLDAFVTLDLHGNFVQDRPLELSIVFATTAIFLVIHLWSIHWSQPPTTPPPIFSF